MRFSSMFQYTEGQCSVFLTALPTVLMTLPSKRPLEFP